MICLGYVAFVVVVVLTFFFSINVSLEPEAHSKLSPVQHAQTVKRTAQADEAPPRANARKGEWGPHVGAVAAPSSETESTKLSLLSRRNARQRPPVHVAQTPKKRRQIVVQPRAEYSERMGYASESLRRW
jgi:hypothetical protein